MAEHVIGTIADFPVGSSTVVKIRTIEIGVFNVAGTLYALPNICPHQYGPLCTGGVNGTMVSGPDTDWQLEWGREGEILTCPWHGIEFDITTGQALANPRFKVRQYPISVVDDKVTITLGS
ncbi:MAG: Rieske (2Fe-2S) protein [Thermomicrobiales bacterium]|nr:Rieske (2Fe-2S) protein [Thermomicrobiales bacterium]MCO5221812.1 Rieske (2Fe-2S) protein [Thermomicrobiales bacterium]